MEPLTWGWRILALVLFIGAMVIISKVGWAFISNGYYWPAFAFLGLCFAYAAWTDYRSAIKLRRESGRR